MAPVHSTLKKGKPLGIKQSDNVNCTSVEQLPNELLDIIFSFLDLRTFKAVRQVNNRFKGAADHSSKAWRKYVVIYPPEKPEDEEQVLQFCWSLPWTNIRFHEERSTRDLKWASSLNKIAKAHSGHSSSLKSIQVATSTWSRSLHFGLFLGPLTLFALCGQSIQSMGLLELTRLQQCINNEFKSVALLRLPSLKFLQVLVSFNLEGLDIALKMCPNLTRLELRFSVDRGNSITPEKLHTAIIAPIISYLDHLDNTSTFTVVFAYPPGGGCKNSLSISAESLQALLAHPKGSLLRLEGLPYHTFVKNPVSIQDQLKVVVKSVYATEEDLVQLLKVELTPPSRPSCVVLLPGRTLELPKRFEFVYTLCKQDWPPPLGQGLFFIGFPAHGVTSISLIGWFTRDLFRTMRIPENDARPFVMALLSGRTDLEELKIELKSEADSKRRPELLFSSPEFPGLGNFPNLKILHLDLWGRRKEDFWEIYENLPLLEELVLRKCYKLTDEGVVGVKGKSMLQLKNLKTLILEGYSEVTDTSFKSVFSQLPRLKRLEVLKKENAKKAITTQSFHALAHPSSRSCNTLEYLKVNKPNCGMAEIKKILQGCRALKKVELLDRVGGSEMTGGDVIVFN